MSLVDLLFRRTHSGWCVGLNRDEVRRAAETAGLELGWDGMHIDEEVSAFAAHLKRRHLVELS